MRATASCILLTVLASVVSHSLAQPIEWVSGGCASGQPTHATKWESVGFHGGAFGNDFALEITPRQADNTSSFSEPRLASGISRIRVSFDMPILADSAIPQNVLVAGYDEEGRPVDLSEIEMSTVAFSGDTQLQIEFSPKLPRNAVYTIDISRVLGCRSEPVHGVTTRCMASLFGDVNEDLRGAANDAAGVADFVGINPIDPWSSHYHARADINNDGRISAGDVGGTVALAGTDLRDVECPSFVRVSKWESIGYHGGGYDGDVAFEISRRNSIDEPAYSEPRWSGISRIRVTFDDAIDAASVGPERIVVRGVDDQDLPIDFSSTTISTTLLEADAELEIEFEPRLPDLAVYTIELVDVLGGNGFPLGGDTSRCMAAVLGDLNGDRRVSAGDVGGSASFNGIGPIDPVAQPFHARADVNNDGRIMANDVGAVAGLIGNDIRVITCP